MYKLFFILVIILTFFNYNGLAKLLYISAETGTISETPTTTDPTLNNMRKVQRDVTSSQNALWITNPSWQSTTPLCEDSVDAYFNEQTGQYQIPQWAIFAQDGGGEGSAEIWIQIYDLETFVLYAFNQGIWVNPNNCQEIWDLTLQYIIVPLINNIHLQKRPTLNARDHGVAIYLMCKTVDASEWLVCSPNDYHRITHANVNIHSPKFRSYMK